MIRNMALAQINASVAHVAALVQGFITIGGPEVQIRSYLVPDQVRVLGPSICRAAVS